MKVGKGPHNHDRRLLACKCINNRKRGRSGKGRSWSCIVLETRTVGEVSCMQVIPFLFVLILDGGLFGGRCLTFLSGLIIMVIWQVGWLLRWGKVWRPYSISDHISFLKSAWRHGVIDYNDKARNTPYFAPWHFGDRLGVYRWPQCKYKRGFYKSQSRLSKITAGNRCRNISTMQKVTNRSLIDSNKLGTWS